MSEMDQLKKAKELAMENSPSQMLPKVLEATMNLYDSVNTTKEFKLQLAMFFPRLMLDILNHEKIPSSERPFIASNHLRSLWTICSNEEDSTVYKHCAFTFAACYAMLFDLVAKTSNQQLWNTMQEMKNFIVSKWDTCYPLHPSSSEDGILLDKAKSIGTKLATAKFISELVIVHTSGNNGTVSIATVPKDHPVISNKSQIESEAKKLLDVLLNYLIEEPLMISSLFIGVINCLSFIIKQRPNAAIRISSALLKFNIDAKYQLGCTSVLNYRLSKRFVERCYKNFVQFCLKAQLIKNAGPMASYHNKLAKISQTLHVIGEETKSKGIMNFEPKKIEKLMSEQEKQKYIQLLKSKQGNREDQLPVLEEPKSSSSTNSSSNGTIEPPNEQRSESNSQTSTPGVDSTTELLMNLQKYTMSKNSIANFFNTSPVAFDNSFGSIYSLMNSKNSEQNVSKLPQDIMIKLCSEAFYNTDTAILISGLSIVASRYTELMTKNAQGSSDPEYARKRKLEGDSAEGLNIKKVKTESEQIKKENVDIGLEEEDEYMADDDNYDISSDQKNEMQLMQPIDMSRDDKFKHLKRIVDRMLKVNESDETVGLSGTSGNNSKPLEKLKLSQWDNKESWLHILTRLATRGVSHDEEMGDVIRQTLYEYFMEDMNNRVTVVIEWLNEEWFYESLLKERGYYQEPEGTQGIYDKWSLKLLDGLIPFLENQHRRLFIRLVSELPSLTQEHINRIRSICLDPARRSLGFQSLKFLVMFRPPVKSMIKELLGQIKEEDSTTSEQCDAILNKFFQ